MKLSTFNMKFLVLSTIDIPYDMPRYLIPNNYEFPDPRLLYEIDLYRLSQDFPRSCIIVDSRGSLFLGIGQARTGLKGRAIIINSCQLDYTKSV